MAKEIFILPLRPLPPLPPPRLPHHFLQNRNDPVRASKIVLHHRPPHLIHLHPHHQGLPPPPQGLLPLQPPHLLRSRRSLSFVS